MTIDERYHELSYLLGFRVYDKFQDNPEWPDSYAMQTLSYECGDPPIIVKERPATREEIELWKFAMETL